MQRVSLTYIETPIPLCQDNSGAKSSRSIFRVAPGNRLYLLSIYKWRRGGELNLTHRGRLILQLRIPRSPLLSGSFEVYVQSQSKSTETILGPKSGKNISPQ